MFKLEKRAQKVKPRWRKLKSYWTSVPVSFYCFCLRPRLHYNATANIPLKIYYVPSIETILCLQYNATANIPLKIYYVPSIETILCLHYNGVVCRSVLTTDHYICHSEYKSISLLNHYVS